MAGESEDESSKTEDPTQKKLEEARKKGQIPSSRELYHFFMMGSLLAFIALFAPITSHQGMGLLTPFISRPDQFTMDAGGVNTLLHELTFGTMLLLLIPFLITIVAALAPAFIQRKWVFSTEHIKPKLSKISPLSGFGRIFGLKALVEFLKNFLKIVVVCLITTMIALSYRDEMPLLIRATDNNALLEYTARMSEKILLGVCIFLFLLAIGDYLYQRFLILKSLRMSKQELKDEYKQSEGDPHIKMKLKQIRRERARKRMMANVPKADVIITNPTHYAVALKYDESSMQAPVVLAKGTDAVAARIREKAGEHKIPIVRNPPLARILYDTTEIEDEIPFEHYQAVAQIIGYVYRLKGKAPKAGPGKKPGDSKNKPPVMPTLKMK
jgi:flagellar biosynthetic protein FlhB